MEEEEADRNSPRTSHHHVTDGALRLYKVVEIFSTRTLGKWRYCSTRSLGRLFLFFLWARALGESKSCRRKRRTKLTGTARGHHIITSLTAPSARIKWWRYFQHVRSLTFTLRLSFSFSCGESAWSWRRWRRGRRRRPPTPRAARLRLRLRPRPRPAGKGTASRAEGLRQGPWTSC